MAASKPLVIVHARQEAAGCMSSSCCHKHQISWRSWTTIIKARKHLILAETLRSVGHLSSCKFDPIGSPWARFEHAASLSSFNYEHAPACGHCTACRIIWDAILARNTSTAAIHSIITDQWLPASYSRLLGLISVTHSDEGCGELCLPYTASHSRVPCPAC
jgi:hypothetical protein